MRLEYRIELDKLEVPRFSVEAVEGIGKVFTLAALVLNVLESKRSVVLGNIQPVPADGDPTRDSVIISNYNTANNKVAATLDVPVSGSSFNVTMTVPANLAADTYYVKVYADNGTDDAFGHTTVQVQ